MKILFGRILFIFIDVLLFVNLAMLFGESFIYPQEFFYAPTEHYWWFSSQSIWNALNDMPNSLDVSLFKSQWDNFVSLLTGANLTDLDAWDTLSGFVVNYLQILVYPFICTWQVLVALNDYIQWFIKIICGFYMTQFVHGEVTWTSGIDTDGISIDYITYTIANLIHN